MDGDVCLSGVCGSDECLGGVCGVVDDFGVVIGGVMGFYGNFVSISPPSMWFLPL